MSYVSLYRKYRPKSFSEVVGQEVVVKILKNCIVNNKIGHAYIFSGPRGTGKTSIAKIFSKAINCLSNKDGDLCGKCDICKLNFDDEIDIIEIDAARVLNEDIDSILMDLQMDTELKEKVDAILSSDKTINQKKIEIRRLGKSIFNLYDRKKMDPAFVKMFKKLLDNIDQV